MNLLPMWRNESWWVRVFDFPRIQLSVLLALLLVLQVIIFNNSLWWTWFMLGVTLACLVYQIWWITPYTPFFPKEVMRAGPSDPSSRLRILSANVLTPNRDSDALIKLVRKYYPHIFVTLESDGWWEKQLSVLEADYPHVIRCPKDNLYGMHVYSKLPLEDIHISYLVEDDKPSMHAIVPLLNGKKVRMHFLHPAPPSPTENDESAERDAELLIVAKHIKQTAGNPPTIVTGDLNDVAWSATTRTFRKLSGLLDPRIGRGTFNTFHAKYWFLRWPLDHLFHSKHFTLSDLRRLEGFGSDHFALFSELVYVGNGNDQESFVHSDREAKQWVQKKEKEEGVKPSDVPL